MTPKIGFDMTKDQAFEQMREALERISDPLKWETEHLPKGYKLDGAGFMSLTANASYYQSIARDALAAAKAVEPQPERKPLTVESAEKMGATGAKPTEAERLLFEAWMKGHCWALCAVWDGASYRGTAEDGSYICPHAMNTRRMWAAWRDSAALREKNASTEQKPLTVESMSHLAAITPRRSDETMHTYGVRVGRAVEAAHGITSKSGTQPAPLASGITAENGGQQ